MRGALRLLAPLAAWCAACLLAVPSTHAAPQQPSPPLRWGADPSGGAPFAFFDPDDPSRVIGFGVDIMEEVARRLGRTLELHRADWLALYDSLEAGRCDVLMNGFEVTEERAAVARFSVPYFAFGQQIVVRAGEAGAVRTLGDLAGRRVAVLNGSASVDVLREAGFDDARILQYDDSLAPYTEVALGRADAALAESIIAAYYAGADARLAIVGEPFAPGTYAAVTRAADAELGADIDRTLRAMQADGALGEILQRWGLWDDAQRALGTERGAPQETLAKARGEPSGMSSAAAAIAPAIAKGAGITVLLTIVAMPLATVAGLFLAIARLSPRAWLRRAAVAYITVVRGTPLLVQVFLAYFSLPPLGQWIYAVSPQFLQAALDPLGGAAFLTLPPLFVGAMCLAANYAAYEAEVHRAGLEAVPAVQWDAARALGLSRAQTLRHVVVPQGVRIALPAIVNDLNSLIKDSCLVSVIGVTDLLGVCLGIGKARFTVPEMLVIAAAVYLALSVAGDLLGARLERRLRARGFGTLEAHARGAHA
ncbi:MAG: ABC transporter substrate-binding protein/permease [Planctomycetaceae bacterium]|nr:ABC transporter substrate-binding protein/permease [Planctomycetaceae bacterium]